MFSLMSLIVFIVACFVDRDALFVASGLFAIAGAIDSFAYKYFKNK